MNYFSQNTPFSFYNFLGPHFLISFPLMTKNIIYPFILLVDPYGEREDHLNKK